MQLLVGNDWSPEVSHRWRGRDWRAQRIIWFAREGDLIILPSEPDVSFFEYATGLTGVTRASIDVAIYYPGDRKSGGATIGSEALTAPRLLNALRDQIGGRSVKRVLAIWPDVEVATLARALGVESKLPGAGFISQDGGRLVNSKAMFRALASGVGVPTPTGSVCSSREAFAEALRAVLSPARPIAVKQEYGAGGQGNEILTMDETLRPIGGKLVVLGQTLTIDEYVGQRWDAISSGGQTKVVVEDYHPNSRAFFAEYDLSDSDVTLAGTGEMLSSPFADAEIMPAQGIGESTLESIIEGGERLSRAVHAIGYRGRLSADAIVTSNNEVFFTEYNGRTTGSTHIYDVIGKRIIGAGYGHDRMILERVWIRRGLFTPSFSSTIDRLRAANLAYDLNSRSGVILHNAFDPRYSGVPYCIVASDLSTAQRIDRDLERIFKKDSD